MIRRSIREWEYLDVSEVGADSAVTRVQADRLLAVARVAQASLRPGGAESAHILVDGRKRLRAQQVVGVLTAPDVFLEILPKIDELDEGATRANLVHMLARIFKLKIADGALVPLGWQRQDLLEILIRLFCDKLFAAVHRGLSRGYIPQEGDLSILRGRLDLKRQFTVLAASPQQLACRYAELSADIALNQILKAAVGRLRYLSRVAENQRRLMELEFVFADVTAATSARLPWDQVVLDRTNTAYHELLRLAQALLGERFQTTSTGSMQGFSLLFEMNTLFEEYIGRSLQGALKGTELKVTLQKPRSYALFEVGSDKKRFMTKPDIVVHCENRAVMIIDTKWKQLKGEIDDPKRGVSQSDVYQMMAYAQVYQVEQLMLLYPHHGGLGADEGTLSEHKMVGTEDSRLSIATVSVSDLHGLSKRLRSLISSRVKLPLLSAA